MKKFLSLILCLLILVSSIQPVYAAEESITPSGIPLSEVESFIDQHMAQYIGQSSPGAAVVLVHNGEIIFSKGYGYADIDSKRPVNSKTTVFEYGSISKLFVYTTIMQLSEQGKIDLEADIRNYLPKNFLKKLKFDKPITMLNIMNHTTGFEDYLFDVVLTRTTNLPTLEDTLLNCQPEQVYKPGTVSAYSNYAVALAAYITEQIIGIDFHKYITNNIFMPLNMVHISAHPLLEDKPELLNDKAKGYCSQNGRGFKEGGWSYIPLYPVGGVNGTAEDLARFAIALMPEDGQKNLLFENQATLTKMLTQTHPMGPGLTGFAHGFIEWDGEFHSLGHGGNTASFSTQMNIVPEERFGVIMLTNAANEINITSGITEALIGKGEKPVPSEVKGLPDSKMVAGIYLPARRMHNSFLEIYGYLSLLQVKSLDSNTIELSIGGQKATLRQTAPYVFERVEAIGPVLQYHLGTVYFDVTDGEVLRMSGDYLPLPKGRSMPLLIASLLALILSILYFLIAPIVLLLQKIRRRIQPLAQSDGGTLYRTASLLVFTGTVAVINNGLLIARMLINNYRSFSEMQIHLYLNYPLLVISLILIVLMVKNWRDDKPSGWQTIHYILTVVILILFWLVLSNWQFFNIVI